MSVGETPITVIGNLTSDPELRYTPAGAALARFTVASTPRTFDRQTNQWKDGTAMFMRCTAWRGLAEHVAESLPKGTRVVASGRLRQFDWTNDAGEKRSMLALEVDDIGPSLLFATTKVERAARTGGNAAPPADDEPDPWATGPAPGGGGAEKPPF